MELWGQVKHKKTCKFLTVCNQQNCQAWRCHSDCGRLADHTDGPAQGGQPGEGCCTADQAFKALLEKRVVAKTIYKFSIKLLIVLFKLLYISNLS